MILNQYLATLHGPEAPMHYERIGLMSWGEKLDLSEQDENILSSLGQKARRSGEIRRVIKRLTEIRGLLTKYDPSIAEISSEDFMLEGWIHSDTTRKLGKMIKERGGDLLEKTVATLTEQDFTALNKIMEDCEREVMRLMTQ